MIDKEEIISSRKLAAYILSRVFKNNSYADIMLDFIFRKYFLSDRDKRFITELVYGTIRWKKKLNWILQKAYRSEWDTIPLSVQLILEMGLYQILYMDKVPDHASVNESVKLTVNEKGMVWGRVVNGVLREIIRNPELQSLPPIEKDPVIALSVNWSHPEWLIEKWITQFGVERTESICRANTEKPNIHLRANTLRNSRETLQKKLSEDGIITRPGKWLPEYLIVTSGTNIIKSNSFQNGDFTIQDESAGLASYLMDPKPGECILDLASAPGGKTTHMAQLCRDQATILAADRQPIRLFKVGINKKRLGFEKIFPILADGKRVLVKPVDKVLVDAPCSGVGVIRRRGELKWNRTPDQIPSRVSLQKKMLTIAAQTLKSSGVVVYSTCSVLPEENEEVVFDFLKHHPEFKIDDARQYVNPILVTKEGFVETWPDLHQVDGSFSARLIKKR